jgi:poly(3-hydroxybutyrate) depolymerase
MASMNHSTSKRLRFAHLVVVLATLAGCKSSGEPPADSVAYSGSFPQATGYATLKIAGRDRRVYVYLPASRPKKPPLVVAFHGTGANSSDDALDAAIAELGVREIADAQGFVLVAPFSTADGGTNADHENGGPGWIFGGDSESNIDLVLARAAIQQARDAYDIDATRVYAVGHSNGAFFTYFAAMKLADRVAAFAENAGGLIACGNRVDCPQIKPGATDCNGVLAGAAASCTCPIGSGSFPTTKPGGRVPQGFLKHNADDATVSAAFTCRLAEHLGNRAQVSIDGSGDHGVTNGFFGKAWGFLSPKTIAD